MNRRSMNVNRSDGTEFIGMDTWQDADEDSAATERRQDQGDAIRLSLHFCWAEASGVGGGKEDGPWRCMLPLVATAAFGGGVEFESGGFTRFARFTPVQVV